MERKTELYSGVYDFALIKTVDSIKLDHMIQPICLPFDTGYFYQILTQLLFNALKITFKSAYFLNGYPENHISRTAFRTDCCIDQKKSKSSFATNNGITKGWDTI